MKRGVREKVQAYADDVADVLDRQRIEVLVERLVNEMVVAPHNLAIDALGQRFEDEAPAHAQEATAPLRGALEQLAHAGGMHAQALGERPPDHRRRDGGLVVRPHNGRGGGHSPRDRRWTAGTLQLRRRRAGRGVALATGTRARDRGEAAVPRARVAWAARGRRDRRPDDDGAAGLVKRQGEAPAGLAARIPELARRVPPRPRAGQGSVNPLALSVPRGPWSQFGSERSNAAARPSATASPDSVGTNHRPPSRSARTTMRPSSKRRATRVSFAASRSTP
jgi:hypothetical protein